MPWRDYRCKIWFYAEFKSLQNEGRNLEIIEAIKFLALRGLPFKGHREQYDNEHRIINPETIDTQIEGLFSDILKLKMKSGSYALK